MIWIVAHWCSCNLGDKFQGYPLITYLIEKGIEFLPVNFSTPDETDIDDIIPNLKIYSWEDTSLSSPEKIIIFSGSLDSGSPWFPLLERNERSNIIIWGGFSRGYSPIGEYRETLKILKRENITMMCRSSDDLQLYQQIVESTNRGIFLGDPMVWWITEEAVNFNIPTILREKELRRCTGKTGVISYFCFENYPDFWKEICKGCDTLVCIDPQSDASVPSFVDGREIIFVREVWDFLKIISSAESVISCRLHASLLCLLLGIPTITITSDSPTEEMLGSYKFFSVIKNTFGYGCGLGEVYSPENIEFNFREVLNRKGFTSEDRRKLYIYRSTEALVCLKEWCNG